MPMTNVFIRHLPVRKAADRHSTRGAKTETT